MWHACRLRGGGGCFAGLAVAVLWMSFTNSARCAGKKDTFSYRYMAHYKMWHLYVTPTKMWRLFWTSVCPRGICISERCFVGPLGCGVWRFTSILPAQGKRALIFCFIVSIIELRGGLKSRLRVGVLFHPKFFFIKSVWNSCILTPRFFGLVCNGYPCQLGFLIKSGSSHNVFIRQQWVLPFTMT